MIRNQIIPEIPRGKAVEKLSINKWLRNPVRPEKLELVFFPGWLFNIEVTASDVKMSEHAFVDAIRGEFSFINNFKIGSQIEGKAVAPGNICQKDAKEIALREYQGFLLMKNLRTKVDAVVNDLTLISQVYYPLWIAYYQNEQKYAYKALDALSGNLQGSRFKPLISDYLLNHQ